MSKIIFFTDLHHGGNLIAPPPQNISIWGKQWAIPLLKGMINYGRKEPNTTMILGGDETTYLHPDTVDDPSLKKPTRGDAKRIYLRNAHEVKDIILNSRLYFARAAGNHDPLGHLDTMGFNRASHVFGRNILPHTDVIVCQPRIDFYAEKTQYYYDADHIISLIDEIDNPNLILTSHWAFDREELGISGKNGYSYNDKTPPIRTHLEEKVRQGKLHSVVTLHGHSHRFRLGKTGPIDMLTMPAITQNNIDTPEYPCGFFVEIEEQPNNGELSMKFKRILLTDARGETPPVIRNVAKAEMDRYSRGRKPAGSHMQFGR